MNPTTENPNPFAVANQAGGAVQVAQSRAAQETQAAMVIAKKFPRNEEQAIQRIQRSCQRKSLAEVACYAYPRGGTTVTGPSIRLAECLAQNWSNMEFGVVELEQNNGESTVMAFAWDLETNTRETKVFQVKHERRVGKGDNFRVDKLTDPRDIYEMVANQGARRLRSCILGVIPGDVVDIAVEQCEKTLSSGSAEPLIDRVRKMATAFSDHGVTVVMLEKRLGHKLDATIEQELVNLRKIYMSLKDGMAKREDFFNLEQSEPIMMPKAKEGPTDEKAESEAGLAPATPKSTSKKQADAANGKGATQSPKEPEPPAQAQQPQESFADETIRILAVDNGIEFGDCRDFLNTNRLVEDAESLGSYTDVPESAWKKLRASAKMVNSLIKTFGKPKA